MYTLVVTRDYKRGETSLINRSMESFQKLCLCQNVIIIRFNKTILNIFQIFKIFQTRLSSDGKAPPWMNDEIKISIKRKN